MHKICECTRFFASHAGSLRRLRVVMLVGLAVLLMAGCQDEGTPDGSNEAAIDDGGKTSDAKGQNAVMVRPSTRMIRRRILGSRLSDCSTGSSETAT